MSHSLMVIFSELKRLEGRSDSLEELGEFIKMLTCRLPKIEYEGHFIDFQQVTWKWEQKPNILASKLFGEEVLVGKWIAIYSDKSYTIDEIIKACRKTLNKED